MSRTNEQHSSPGRNSKLYPTRGLRAGEVVRSPDRLRELLSQTASAADHAGFIYVALTPDGEPQMVAEHVYEERGGDRVRELVAIVRSALDFSDGEDGSEG